MSTILLINAPFYDLYGVSKNAFSYYFPLGIGYIASFLMKHGYSVDLIVESKDKDIYESLCEKLESGKYLYIGISSMTSAFPAAIKVAKTIRRLCPQTPIVLGGAHVSGVGPQCIEDHPEIDFLCIGEGEITSLELARALEQENPDLATINGLVWRGSQGKIMVNSPRAFHLNIDDFPFPARHLVDFEDFSIHSHVVAGGGASATVITSRGCPFGCIFCSAHLTDGKKYRFHSDDYIITELRLLKEKWNVSYVFFEDDTLTVVKKRLTRLCERIKKEKLNLDFGCFSRVDVFDEKTAKLLNESGFRMVIFGIESGVPEILKKIGKSANIEQARRAIELCAKYKIKSYASFVVGFPFESKRDIEQTIAFGKSLNASVLTFNPLVPFPGTPLFIEEKHRPGDTAGWSRFLTMGKPPFDMTPGVSADQLKAMVDRAHLLYYLNPKRLLRMIAGIRSFSELLSYFRAFTGMVRRSFN